MKSRKMNIVLIIINVILIGIICSFITKDRNLVRRQQIIKEMSETEYESQVQELNKSHKDYATYIENCKISIATALTNEGVTTSSEDTLEKMSDNISKIFTERTKIDSTDAAKENDIVEGKQAYVDGNLVIGTLAQNNDLEDKYLINTIYRSGHSGIQNFSQTIDCSSLPNYKDLTEDNFMILNDQNEGSTEYNDFFHAFTSSESAYSVQYVSKSYNSDTGILTVNMRSLWLYQFKFLLIIKIV